jgi:hypothetical protein
LSAANVFSSCRLARCPHCGQSQFPTVELHSPINAFELDPSVAVLFEETNISYGSDGDIDSSEDAGLGYAEHRLASKDLAPTPRVHPATTPSSSSSNHGGKAHSSPNPMLSPCTTTDESCVSSSSRNAWCDHCVPLLVPKQTAAEMLVLMTHAR